MYPLNEYGIEKIICTTIRPSEMPYRGLYDIRDCALFLSNFLAYEPLENPIRYPEYIPSPEIVLKWRRGDCFDFAILLTSLLLGEGCDAYCVCGIAPKWITERDLSKQKCPFLNLNTETKEEEKKEEVKSDEPYQIPPKRYESSLYQLEKEREEEQERLRKKIYDENESDEEYPEDPEDLLEGKRLHCWVMVQAGKRSVEKHILIEPSTGNVYDIDNSPYLKMLFVWNNDNIWVNVHSDDLPINMSSINLRNREIWEYNILFYRNVFYEPAIDELKASIKPKDQEEDLDGLNNEETEYVESKKPDYMDVPVSWVEPFTIERDDYEKQFAGSDKPGEETILYEKCKLERFGLLCNDEGLTCRITEYKDLKRVYPLKITEEYKNRQDRLLKRIKLPDENKITEYFAPGRNCQEKEIVDIPGKEKEVKFYTIARLDGLSSRKEVIGKKLIETYENTPDKILYYFILLVIEV